MSENRINKKENTSAEFEDLGQQQLNELTGFSKKKIEAYEKLSEAAHLCAETGLAVGIIAVEINTNIEAAKSKPHPADLAVCKLFLNK